MLGFLAIMEIRTVKVSNLSLGATEHDVKEFFSFSGEIENIEIHGDNERSQIAHVIFKDHQGAETAILLSGATIVDQSVTIELDPEYKSQVASSAPSTATDNRSAYGAESAIHKAEDVVSSMLAKGFILGKDALSRAKAFDDKLQLTSTATSKVASLDQKIGLSEKITVGTSIVNEKVKEADQKFRVSETTMSAFAAAEQTVSNAGSAIMKNRYVLTGASWVTGAFNRVTKAAADMGQKTKEKVLAEEERGQNSEGSAQIRGSGSPKAAISEQMTKPSQ